MIYSSHVRTSELRSRESGDIPVVLPFKSIWVTPDPDVPDAERESLADLAEAITEAVGIRLEYEAEYEWVAFVLQRESDAGALTK